MDQEQLFLQHIQDNFGIIRKVVGLYIDHPDDRADLQQEILLQAWKSFPSFNGLSKFSTWLYRISLNTVLTFRRRDKSDRLQALDATAVQMTDPLNEDPTDQSDRLYRAIRALPEAERAIIILHLDGYDNEEIAGIAGLTKNHVAVKLHRIKTELINRLKN